MSQRPSLAIDATRRRPLTAVGHGTQANPASIKPIDLQLGPPAPKSRRKSFTKIQLALFCSAAIILIAGTLVFWGSSHKQQALIRHASADGGVPSTSKPTAAAVANYTVAPDRPKYLNIPELGIHTRIFSLGTLANGALAAPNNVFDAGWYDKSSLPGKPGAMLIDGHVSSWTSKGVFYGLRNLQPGDKLTVVRGDDTVFNYQVVRSQVFSADHVDMKAAMTPVIPDVPGLNLITCSGKVKPGTSEFNERLIVFTKQI